MVLGIQPIRYAQNEAFSDYSGLLLSTSGISVAAYDNVTGFNVESNIPSGSWIRIMLKPGSSWGYFNAGSWTEIGSSVDFDAVEANGNTPEELNSIVSGLSAFDGSSEIYIAIAMFSPADTSEFPKCKVAVKCYTVEPVLSQTYESPVYQIPEGKILNINAVVTTGGNGTASVQASVLQGGAWSPYTAIANLLDAMISGIKFRMIASVGSVASGNGVSFTGVSAVVQPTSQIVPSEAVAYLYTNYYDFAWEMRRLRVILERSKIKDTALTVDVSLANSGTVVVDELLGYGTGALKNYPLANPVNVPIKSLFVRVGDSLKVAGTDFSFSTANGIVSINAPAGQAIRAAYIHGVAPETWSGVPLRRSSSPLGKPLLLEDDFEMEPTLTTPYGVNSAVRIGIASLSGSVSAEVHGMTTGSIQYVYPKHNIVDSSSIIVYLDNVPTVNWTWNSTGKWIRLQGAAGKVISLDYDYIGEPGDLHAMKLLWNEE